MSKNILLINVSPRKKGSSAVILDYVEEALNACGDAAQRMDLHKHINNMEAFAEPVKEADTLFICGPCYINTYPADVVGLLETLAASPGALHGQNVYGLIQGGMPYEHTHVSGLTMLRLFAEDVNLVYRGGFVIGLGATMDGKPLSSLPNGKKVQRQLSVFCAHMHRGDESPDSVYRSSLIRLPRFALGFMIAKMNQKIDKSYAARGMDASKPTPYQLDEIV